MRATTFHSNCYCETKGAGRLAGFRSNWPVSHRCRRKKQDHSWLILCVRLHCLFTFIHVTQVTHHLSPYKLLHWLEQPSNHSIKHAFMPHPHCIGKGHQTTINTSHFLLACLTESYVNTDIHSGSYSYVAYLFNPYCLILWSLPFPSSSFYALSSSFHW